MMFLILFQMILDDFFELIDDILSILALQLEPSQNKSKKKGIRFGL